MMKFIKKLFRWLLVLALLAGVAVFGINEYVKSVAREKLIEVETAAELQDVDCILVLGCWVDTALPV